MKNILIILCFISLMSCNRYMEGRYENGEYLVSNVEYIDDEISVFVLESNYLYKNTKGNSSYDRYSDILLIDHKGKFEPGDRLEFTKVDETRILLDTLISRGEIDSVTYNKYKNIY